MSAASDAAALAAPLDHRAERMERALLVAATLFGAATFWLAPRLPMADLPQHAGQVALWRDLILGVSPFAGDVWINLFTPYLVGYGAALPLAFVMEPGEALRVILALSFVAFVAAGRGLRRELGADPRVDWLFLFGFFGVGWSWGLYTFLVAAPVTLWMIRLAVRFDARPDMRRALALVGAGLALLFCHGLQFVFAVAIGAAIVSEHALRVANAQGLRAGVMTGLRRCGPSTALTLAFAAFMILRAALLGQQEASPSVFGAPVWERPMNALTFIWSADPQFAFAALTLAAIVASLRMNLAPARGPGMAMFLCVIAIELFCVSIAMNTGFIYKRFALYLIPFWALCLKPTGARRSPRFAHVALILCACAGLGLHAWRVAAFARNDRGFDRILAAIKPGERALGLVYERADEDVGNAYLYLHWPVWAQSTRGAFVDFNFAHFHPQVVRFRPGKTPPVLEFENAEPERLDWTGWRAASYDVFITRGTLAQKTEYLLARSPCRLEEAANAGEWTLYRKTACGS